MAGSVIQAASLSTINAETHVLFRIKRDLDVANFVKRYGDSGEDTFDDAGGTIPQRLLLMNGNMITDQHREQSAGNASTRIGMLAPDNATAVEAAYLVVFTRRPRDGGGSFCRPAYHRQKQQLTQQCDVRPLLDAHERHRVFLESLSPAATNGNDTNIREFRMTNDEYFFLPGSRA
jgi:hypothetical protein